MYGVWIEGETGRWKAAEKRSSKHEFARRILDEVTTGQLQMALLRLDK